MTDTKKYKVMPQGPLESGTVRSVQLQARTVSLGPPSALGRGALTPCPLQQPCCLSVFAFPLPIPPVIIWALAYSCSPLATGILSTHFRPPVSHESFPTAYTHHNPAARLTGLISGQSSSPSTSVLQQDLASCNSQTPFALAFWPLYMLSPCLGQRPPPPHPGLSLSISSSWKDG